MAGREVASKRYARAIFDLAREQDAFDRWRSDLGVLRALVSEPTVGAYLDSSAVPEADKRRILAQGLDGVHQDAVNLAGLLTRKHRIRLIGEIAETFDELVNVERRVVVAEVTTAVPLTDAGRAAIVQSVQQQSGASEVQLDERVDREILGGAIIQVGDHIVDGSVRTRLRGLRGSIAGTMQ